MGLPFGMFSSDKMFDSLLLMLSGMFLIMFGGWLLLFCTYRGVLLGFLYGLCSPVLKSIVMSWKSISFLFASFVIFSLFSLNIFHISFLIFSVCLAVLLHVASPSSLYSPMFVSSFSTCDSMYSPTSSHVSATTIDLTDTSKFEFFLHHSVWSLYRSDCFVCVINTLDNAIESQHVDGT